MRILLITTIVSLLLLSCKKDDDTVVDTTTTQRIPIGSIPQYDVCCEPSGYSRTDTLTVVTSPIGRYYGARDYWYCGTSWDSGPHGPSISFLTDSTINHSAHLGYGELRYEVSRDSEIDKDVFTVYYNESSPSSSDSSIFAKMYFSGDDFYELNIYRFEGYAYLESEKTFENASYHYTRFDNDRTKRSMKCDSFLIEYEYIYE